MKATGKSYAGDSFASLERILDRYVHDWSAMYRDACEATNVRRDQSAEVLDLRMGCLRDRWGELRALSDVLVEGEGVAVTNAVAAATALTPIENCADVASLRTGLMLPADPPTRQRVTALRGQIVEMTALQNAGHYSRALGMAPRVLSDARALGYRPVIAEALFHFSRLELETGQDSQASDNLEQAMWIAEASAHDELAAQVAVENIYVAGYLHYDVAQARRWMHQAQALLERIGGHDQLRAWMLSNYAAALYIAGKSEEAASEYFRALQIKERVLGKDHPDVAETLADLADQLQGLGRPLEALDFSNRGVDIIDRSLGPSHPAMAHQLDNRAEILNQLGRYQDARQDAERAVAICEEAGPDNRFLVFALEPLGEAKLGLGHPEQAIGPLERGLELAEGSDMKPDLPRLRFLLARALWDSGRDHARAIRLATMAARQKPTMDAPSQEQVRRRAAAWLASKRQ
jgi:tetratricopeptide (TPR) repeat protein